MDTSVIRRLFSLVWIAAVPILWLYSLWMGARTKTHAGKNRFAERLGLPGISSERRHGVLIHAASVGEIVAAAPLVHQLARDMPSLPLTLTCTSLTGARRLQADFGEQALVRFLPLDAGPIVGRFLDELDPRVIVLIETELWPNLLHEAQQRCIPVMLANARLSARSCRRYRRFERLTFDMLSSLHLVLAQDLATARRFKYLGVNESRLVITGNLKSDVEPDPAQVAASAVIRQRIGRRTVLVAASTHEGEESRILQAWEQMRDIDERWLLIVAPRHPQRFDAVARLIQSRGFACVRRSRGEFPDTSQSVWLADSMGEMQTWFALAELAFIGGSLIPHGGHNPIEAMMHRCAVISGRHVRNFAAVFSQLDRHSAVGWIDEAEGIELVQELSRLMKDEDHRQVMALAGHEIYRHSTGAAYRTAELVKQILVSPVGSLRRVRTQDELSWTDQTFIPPLPKHPFNVNAWQHKGSWSATDNAQRSERFLRHGNGELVLHHFHRHSLVSRRSVDRHVGKVGLTGRSIRAFALLSQMRSLGLPVPRPLGVRVVRAGRYSYKADLLIERIPGALPLTHHLTEDTHTVSLPWKAIGETIRRFHDHGFDHVDLNARDILLGAQGDVWISEFDRCVRRPKGSWQLRALSRLRRSVLTAEPRLNTSAFCVQLERIWSDLDAGYSTKFQPETH